MLKLLEVWKTDETKRAKEGEKILQKGLVETSHKHAMDKNHK